MPSPVGADLYNNNCARCHGPLATSKVRGASIRDLKEAISEVEGGMRKFRKLTAAQLQSLIIALNTKPAPKPKPVIGGAALYSSKCASCHGPLATSKVKGKTAAQVQGAIGSVRAMGAFKSLTQDQVAAIAKALAGTPASSGSGTWGGSCAACHNSNGSVKPGAGSMPGGEPEGSDD